MKTNIILAAAAAIALVACDKSENICPDTPSMDGAQVKIAFAAPKSRAFGTGATETWELAANTATALVFDASGNIRFRRDLSAAELASAPTVPVALVIPGVAVGDLCAFAVVANRTVPTSVTSKSQLEAIVENDAAAYNGSFTEATSRALRPGGFVMSGTASAAIVSGTTSVAIELRRVVAKVEIQAATTPAFAAKYGVATVTVNKATLTQCASGSYLMDLTPAGLYAAAGHTDSFVQNADTGCNLFYLFEQPAAAEGARVKVTLDATYDADGNSTTTVDQVPLVYELELSGVSAGQIARNGAYLVQANINGLTGDDISMMVSVKTWETLVTQDINLGN